MELADLQNWLQTRRVNEISCIVPAITGAARGKSMAPSLFLENYANGGLRVSEVTYAINVHGEITYNDHVDRVERDLELQCDLSTIHLTPWTRDRTACIICDAAARDGTPYWLAPRQVLKDVVARYHAKGWTPIVGPEVEFYLIAKFEDVIIKPQPPRGSSGLSEFGQHVFSLDAIDEFDELFEELYEFSETQGIQLETLIHEDGPCQFEISIRHSDALAVADQLFLFKRLARQVAKRHGAFVTFMAKPYWEESGSSIHLHQSVVDTETGRNVFADADGSDSDLFRWFVGGLQTHLPAAMPFIAPYTNSYNRFEAFMSAPTNVHWGRENRTVGFRAPASSPEARRIENRISGADVNPYLAVAASLACGYIGMTEKIEPEAEFEGEAYETTDHALPRTLTQALELLRGSAALRGVFGDALIDTYADIKNDEYEHRSSVLSPWDVRYLMVNV
ncbi:MAG: glutamine synthetase family protein [Parvularculaceae bacterium]